MDLKAPLQQLYEEDKRRMEGYYGSPIDSLFGILSDESHERIARVLKKENAEPTEIIREYAVLAEPIFLNPTNPRSVIDGTESLNTVYRILEDVERIAADHKNNSEADRIYNARRTVHVKLQALLQYLG